MEIKKFKIFSKKGASISTVGYLKQRMKLNPEAFVSLNDFHLKNFYKEVKYLRKVNGYLVLAVDGSNLNIPTTPENLELYGTCSSEGKKAQASLGISSLYDVTNRMILDCTINRCKFKESDQVGKHLEKLPAMLGKHKYILTLDRGYPSIPLFISLCDNNQKFVVRLRASDYKKEKSQMKTTDEEVNLQCLTRDRLKPYKGTTMEKILKERKSIILRFVKIELKNGELEYLATNLEKEEFSTEEMGALYSMRYGVETAFDALKNKLEIENFTGQKSLLIQQDIHSCVYLYNLTQDIVMEAEEEMKEELEGKYKYRMMINRSLAIGILKEELIEVVLEKNLRKKSEKFRGIFSQIKHHLIPIRSNRSFKRIKGNLAGKYSNTHKRSY